MRLGDQLRENVGIALDALRTSKLRSALTILGVGLSGLIGEAFVGQRRNAIPKLHVEGLSEIPLIGPTSIS